MPNTFGQNRLLAAFPPDILAGLGDEIRYRTLAQGQVIYEPGAPMETVFFPQSGLISLTVVVKTGAQIETGTVGREGAVGLHGAIGNRFSFTRATSQIGGVCAAIRAARLRQLADGAVRDLIGNYLEITGAEAQQLAACNAVHDANSRLCRWLLQSADRTDSDQLPLTHEFLAQMLGVRRTTVTLLAQALQSTGMIRYSRGKIVLRDRDRLAAAACECYHAMHHRKLALTLGISL
ncbi:MAG: Crp/Fnr family transcriptional regulator [Xanthobacteraceae bacterium]